MRIGSLFSGIGGLELGLEWSGVGHTVWQVEREPFCRAVLAKHWPAAERFDDVRTVGKANLAPVDLICGGFPCQDVSSAGKGAGLAGERSGLWREFARILGELQPGWVVVENVAGGAAKVGRHDPA
jgi:DNA (cytosine-5)-methyltransferase 1